MRPLAWSLCAHSHADGAIALASCAMAEPCQSAIATSRSRPRLPRPDRRRTNRTPAASGGSRRASCAFRFGSSEPRPPIEGRAKKAEGVRRHHLVLVVELLLAHAQMSSKPPLEAAGRFRYVGGLGHLRVRIVGSPDR